MNDLITHDYHSNQSFTKSKGRWLPYLLLGIATNSMIWGLAFLYLKLKHPSYTSNFALSVPAAASATNVNLPNIGAATYKSDSPYQISTQDPRENYKFLVTSEPVLSAAATKLHIPLAKFGSPRVKIVNNTTIMTVEFKGDTPEEAQKKSFAIYEALLARIDELKRIEAARQEERLQSTLGAAQTKLKNAQNALSEYKARSGLNANEQVSSLSTNIEELRKQQAEVIAQQQQANARVRQLSNNLNVSTQQAADAFILQRDPLFQKYLQDYSEAKGTLVVLNSKFLPDNPAVVQQQAKRDAAQKAILERGQVLLGRPINEAALNQLNPSNSTNQSNSAREELSKELVTVQADQQGFLAQAQALGQQRQQLERRLQTLAQQEVTLQSLQRDVQIAEAVFSSTLTTLDINKSNVSSSYPQLELFTQPSLPTTPSSPKKLFVLLGASLGSLFITTGLVLLWLRKNRNTSLKQGGYKDIDSKQFHPDSKSELLNSKKNT